MGTATGFSIFFHVIFFFFFYFYYHLIKSTHSTRRHERYVILCYYSTINILVLIFKPRVLQRFVKGCSFRISKELKLPPPFAQMENLWKEGVKKCAQLLIVTSLLITTQYTTNIFPIWYTWSNSMYSMHFNLYTKDTPINKLKTKVIFYITIHTVWLSVIILPIYDRGILLKTLTQL